MEEIIISDPICSSTIIKEEVDLDTISIDDDCEEIYNDSGSSHTRNTRNKKAKKSFDNFAEKQNRVPFMKTDCQGQCEYECKKLSEREKHKILKAFRTLSSRADKLDFISRHITTIRARKLIRRQYFFTVKNEPLRVCRKTFLGTLGISSYYADVLAKEKKLSAFNSVYQRESDDDIKSETIIVQINDNTESITDLNEYPDKTIRQVRLTEQSNTIHKKPLKLNLVMVKKGSKLQSTIGGKNNKNEFKLISLADDSTSVSDADETIKKKPTAEILRVKKPQELQSNFIEESDKNQSDASSLDVSIPASDDPNKSATEKLEVKKQAENKISKKEVQLIDDVSGKQQINNQQQRCKEMKQIQGKRKHEQIIVLGKDGKEEILKPVCFMGKTFRQCKKQLKPGLVKIKKPCELQSSLTAKSSSNHDSDSDPEVTIIETVKVKKEVNLPSSKFINKLPEKIKYVKIAPKDYTKNACTCELNCSIPEQEKKKIFRKFSNIFFYPDKLEFIARHIQITPMNESKTQPYDGGTEFIRNYFLEVHGKLQRVCESEFKNILSITGHLICSALERSRNTNKLQLKKLDIQEDQKVLVPNKSAINRLQDTGQGKSVSDPKTNQIDEIIEVPKRKTFGQSGNSALCNGDCEFLCMDADIQKEKIFHEFWSIGENLGRYLYILNCIRMNPLRTGEDKPSLQYYLECSGILKRVCKLTFFETLSIKEGWVIAAIKKVGHLVFNISINREMFDVPNENLSEALTEDENEKLIDRLRQRMVFCHCCRIQEKKRQKVFVDFWNIADVKERYKFILNLIESIPWKNNSGVFSKGSSNQMYFLEIDGKREKVCKLMFKDTLDISNKLIRTAFEKMGFLPSVEMENLKEKGNLEEKISLDASQNPAKDQNSKPVQKKKVIDDMKKDHDSLMKYQISRKEAMESGQPYIKQNGELRPARTIRRGCNVLCKFKCQNLQNYRKELFDKFWQIPTRSEKLQHLSRLIEVCPTNEKRLRKHFYRKYFFEIDGQLRRVCQTMFSATLDIDQFWVNNTLKRFGARAVIFVDEQIDEQAFLKEESTENITDPIASSENQIDSQEEDAAEPYIKIETID